MSLFADLLASALPLLLLAAVVIHHCNTKRGVPSAAQGRRLPPQADAPTPSTPNSEVTHGPR